MPVLIHSARRGQNPAVIFPSALLVEGSAPKPLWTQNFILRLRVLRTLWTMTGSPLAVVFFLLSTNIFVKKICAPAIPSGAQIPLIYVRFSFLPVSQ